VVVPPYGSSLSTRLKNKARTGEEEEGELARGNERGTRRNRAIAGWSETKTIATQ